MAFERILQIVEAGALVADARRQNQSTIERAHDRRHLDPKGRAQNGADDLRALRLVERIDFACQRFGDGQARFLDARGLDHASLGIGRQHDDEDARAIVGGRLEDRLESAEPEIGAYRDRIRPVRAVGAEEGVGIAFAGGADVTALAVEQEKKPALAGHVADTLKDLEAIRALALEIGHLRLDHGGQAVDGLEHAFTEGPQPLDVVVQTGRLERRPRWIETKTERGKIVAERGEPFKEGTHVALASSSGRRWTMASADTWTIRHANASRVDTRRSVFFAVATS